MERIIANATHYCTTCNVDLRVVGVCCDQGTPVDVPPELSPPMDNYAAIRAEYGTIQPYCVDCCPRTPNHAEATRANLRESGFLVPNVNPPLNRYQIHATVRFVVEAYTDEEAKDVAAHQLSSEGIGDSPVDIYGVELMKSASEVESDLQELRGHYHYTDDQVIRMAQDGSLPPNPHFVEWLVLLGRGDLV